MFQDISSILAIAAATWAGWEAYRANQRFEEESKPVFRTDVFSEKTEDFRTIRLGIQNQDKNSIFVEELQPLNFDKIIPEFGSKVEQSGLWVVHFGDPASTYKMSGTEIESGKWINFHFKIPLQVKRIRLKVIYSETTSTGLKKASCIYDYLLPSYLIDNSQQPD